MVIFGYKVISISARSLLWEIQNYGITELVLTGLTCNIHGFSQLLKYQYFEVLVDHKAIEN